MKERSERGKKEKGGIKLGLLEEMIKYESV